MPALQTSTGANWKSFPSEFQMHRHGFSAFSYSCIKFEQETYGRCSSGLVVEWIKSCCISLTGFGSITMVAQSGDSESNVSLCQLVCENVGPMLYGSQLLTNWTWHTMIECACLFIYLFLADCSTQPSQTALLNSPCLERYQMCGISSLALLML